MIRYFDVPTKFISVEWGDLENGDEVWYEMDNREGIHGPFYVESIDDKKILNLNIRSIDTKKFPIPITLYQRLA